MKLTVEAAGRRGIRPDPELACGKLPICAYGYRGRRGRCAGPHCLHSPPVRVWIDITAPAHVLVFRPLIGLLEERGAEVEVTSRHYAQTVGLLELHGIPAELMGTHGAGASESCEP